jgi:biofilm PGA synthesis N-glycosyltransferase PgaC
MTILFYLIIFICLINLLRLGVFLITSDIYSLRQARLSTQRKRWHLPTVSVVIPAHNEEKTIIRALKSVCASNYPISKVEIIIANDGSTDNTAQLIKDFKREYGGNHKIRLVTRPNRGKASALNYAIRRFAKGSLVMCLDSDSYLETNALRIAVQQFRNRNIVAVAANVNIIEDGSMLGLAQRFEYMMGYQMKKGQSLMGIDYIIGGIGSVFRRSTMERVEYYDTNTMTEDIDLTMKIIVKCRKNQKIGYAADSIVYTEPAHTLKELMIQRYRWKYGRSQTFLKHSFAFFSHDSRISKRLSWFMFPFVLFQDLIFSLEPLIFGYFLYICIAYGSFATYLIAFILWVGILMVIVWSGTWLTVKERIRLSICAPLMYLMLYVLAIADYYALAKAAILSPKLKSSIQNKHVTWNSPARRESVV